MTGGAVKKFQNNFEKSKHTAFLDHRRQLGAVDDLGIGGNTLYQPDVAADDRAAPDAGITAEDSGTGVDNHVVLNVGVALDAFDGIAVLVKGEGACAQRHALIHLDPVADGGCLTDDNTGTVVNEEAFADLRAGMDVDTGALVGIFAHDAGDNGDALLIEHMGKAVDGDGLDEGIGQQNFLAVAHGGVSLKGGTDVEVEHLADLGQLCKHGLRDIIGATLTAAAGFLLSTAALTVEHLMDEGREGHRSLTQFGTDEDIGAILVDGNIFVDTGEHGTAQQLDELDDALASGGAQRAFFLHELLMTFIKGGGDAGKIPVEPVI